VKLETDSWVKPVQVGGRNAGFKQDGGASRSLFKQVQAALISYLDPASPAGIALAVAAGADQLIEDPRGGQGRGNSENAEKQVHGRPRNGEVGRD